MVDRSLSQAVPVGLVLSGGGAKGAYQVGVLKALNELGVEASMLAGASIGSLNGAIIAAAENQADAAAHLEELWTGLAEISPISLGSKTFRLPAYVTVLGAFGLNSSLFMSLAAAAEKTSSVLPRSITKIAKALAEHAGIAQIFDNAEEGLLCSGPIKSLIDRFLGSNGLPARLPLHVSIYPTEGAKIDLLRIAGAMLSLTDTRASEFVHIQSLPPTEQKQLLLASAALPLLYAPQEINGQLYTDGGQGGWKDVQGNTPITPLLRAGCKHVIVTHLSDGSFWDRSLFPGVNIIEIRPKSRSIQRKGAITDVLGFDNEKIPSWIEQGYEDTRACVEPIIKTFKIFGELEASKRTLDAEISHTGESGLRKAMESLGQSRLD